MRKGFVEKSKVDVQNSKSESQRKREHFAKRDVGFKAVKLIY